MDEEEFVGLLDEMDHGEEEGLLAMDDDDDDGPPDWPFPSSHSDTSSFTFPLLSPLTSPHPSETLPILTHIENLITTLTTSLTSSPSTLSIPLHSRRPQSTFFCTDTSSILPLPAHPSHFSKTTFPRNPRQFTSLLSVLSILHSHHSLEQSSSTSAAVAVPLTKRDIYYRNPALFRTQRSVDRILDCLAATFRTNRAHLGIVAAGKGLVYGDVYVAEQHFISGGGLIPQDIRQIATHPRVSAVLLVEKETVFRALATPRSGLVQNGILLVTGKGYPDLLTRHFLQKLREELPVFALVDFDPDGLEIAGTYRFGSASLAHEKVSVPDLRLVGVRAQDVLRSSGDNDPVLVPLSTRDRKKAATVLNRPWMGKVPHWKHELQRMLFLGVKAEVEMFAGENFSNWVLDKIERCHANHFR